jgi:hypothetical protein
VSGPIFLPAFIAVYTWVFEHPVGLFAEPLHFETTSWPVIFPFFKRYNLAVLPAGTIEKVFFEITIEDDLPSSEMASNFVPVGGSLLNVPLIGFSAAYTADTAKRKTNVPARIFFMEPPIDL